MVCSLRLRLWSDRWCIGDWDWDRDLLEKLERKWLVLCAGGGGMLAPEMRGLVMGDDWARS